MTRRARTLPPRLALVALVVLAVVAASCATDEPVAEGPRTTVPVPTTAPVDPAAPATPTSDAPATPTTGPVEPDPRSIPGDLALVTIALEPLATMTEPIDTAVAPNGEFWIARRAGTIVVLDPATGVIGDTVLDLSADTVAGGERGLLGIAVDDTHLYVDYTDPSGTTHVDAFTLDADGRPGDRRALLEVDQPYGNHNGGGLAIGPDGHLYIGLGDGGSANDPLGAGQDPTQLLGSILRIDPTPEAEAPYAIPADNPYADGVEGRPEIFLIGARNPWRFSFDPITDDLWVADVGQNRWEEVDLLLGVNGWGRGANLGWNLREATHEFAGERPPGNVDPVFEYPHSGATPSGCSISGGQVYRGLAIPELVGSYVFADYCGSSIWAISIVGDAIVFRDLGGSVDRVVGITVDPDGELLTLSLSGTVNRVVAG